MTTDTRSNLGSAGPIRILHLSDLHFTAGKTWDADPVLRALVRFIRDETERGFSADLIAITGDIAYSGKAEEYVLAFKWLEEQLFPALPKSLPRERLLLVPGNHDVDRMLIGPGAHALQDTFLRHGDQVKIAAALKESRERDHLLRRHDSYLAFLKRWYGTPQPLPWWRRRFELRGQTVDVFGLDSAWMSCSDHDRGKLLISRYQLHQTVLADCDERANWRIALMHHPWDDLARFDFDETRAGIRQHCHLLLRGHLHAPMTERTSRADSDRQSCLELAAGCVYDDSQFPNAFQWIELDSAGSSIKVHYRIWNDGRWMVDRNQPGGEVGHAQFDWKEKTRPSASDPYRSQATLEAAKNLPFSQHESVLSRPWILVFGTVVLAVSFLLGVIASPYMQDDNGAGGQASLAGQMDRKAAILASHRIRIGISGQKENWLNAIGKTEAGSGLYVKIGGSLANQLTQFWGQRVDSCFLQRPQREDLLAMLKNQELDLVLASITSLPEREIAWGVEFSTPFLRPHYGILAYQPAQNGAPTANRSTSIIDISEKQSLIDFLKEKNCIYTRHTSAEVLLESYRCKQKTPADDRANALLSMVNEKDIFLTDLPFIEFPLELPRGDLDKSVYRLALSALSQDTPDSIRDQHYAAAVSKGSVQLLHAINSGILQLQQEGALTDMEECAKNEYRKAHGIPINNLRQNCERFKFAYRLCDGLNRPVIETNAATTR